MVNVLILVGSTNRRKSVKFAIVEILSMEWPLSLKALHYLLSKKYALNVSYQAVHKAIKQLTENQIVEKDNRYYLLNMAWISKVKDFGKETELAYSSDTNFYKNEFEVVASLLNRDKTP